MARPTISLNVVTYNEAARIERCLSAVAPYVDEMIVVDQCSTDDTRAIAAGLGATVITDTWHGYGDPSRPVAEAASVGEWILMLDADEELNDPAAIRIAAEEPDIGGWCFPRGNFFGGQLWSVEEDGILRMFRRGKAVWPAYTRPHLQPVVERVARRGWPCIIHDKTWAEQLADDESYERLGAGTGLFLALARDRGVTGAQLDAMGIELARAFGFDCAAVMAAR